MFKKFKKELDTEKINEVATLSARVLKIIYLLLAFLVVYIVIRLFKETNILSFIGTIISILMPLIIGIIIAWLFEPFVNFLETKKIKRVLGTIITYIILFLIVILVLSALLPLLAEQISQFVGAAPDIFSAIKGWCLGIFDYLKTVEYIDAEALKDEFFVKFEEIAVGISSSLPNQLISFVSSLFSGLGTFAIGLIIGFLLLVNFRGIENILKLLPKKYRNTGMELAGEVNVSLRSYVQGALIDCGVVFILTSIGFWVIGLEAPVLFGFFCGITNIIPYIGPYIGGAPAVIVGLTQSPTIGILTLIIIVVIQFLEGNLLQPYIMSKTTKLNAIVIMLGLLVFGYFFGIIGMLLSTPILAAIKTIFQFFNRKYGLLDYTLDDVSIAKNKIVEKKE